MTPGGEVTGDDLLALPQQQRQQQRRTLDRTSPTLWMLPDAVCLEEEAELATQQGPRWGKGMSKSQRWEPWPRPLTWLGGSTR